MPVIKSAKKKLRKDRKQEKENSSFEKLLRSLVKNARKNPSVGSIKKVFKVADKAAKKRIIHKNKASRIKSQISKLLKPSKKTKS